MPFQCCSWICHLFHQIIGGEDFINSMPDDVLIDILCRLPAQSVFQCRKVCSRWRVLTLSPDFIELHLRKASPAAFVPHVPKECMKFSVVDEECEVEYDLKGLEALQLDVAIRCCNGLLLFRTHNPASRYVVLNPLSKGRINILDSFGMGTAFGFYFHPLEKKYRILFRRRCLGGTDPTSYEHLIFQLEDNKRRTASVRNFPWTPCYRSQSKVINGALHWLVGCGDTSGTYSPIVGIMEFEIDSEKFCMRSLPLEEFSTDNLNRMELLAANGDHLCICRPIYEKLKLDIWILEDYRSWTWTLKYRVNLDWGLKDYPSCLRTNRLCLRVLSIHRNQLRLCWIGKGLFSYHLGCHSVKKMSCLHYAAYGYVMPYTESAVVLQG